ncbi:MAG: hypothetical protein ACRCYQ_13640, partial [Nocardioides sp.]
GYPRLEWWVLGWNQPAIDFYSSLGARGMPEWTHYRMERPALGELGARGFAVAWSSGREELP